MYSLQWGVRMSTEEFYKFMIAQTKKIMVDKFDEGVRICRDPGSEYVLSWIKEKAADFREKWQVCKCRTCIHAKDCGFKEAQECPYYQSEEKDGEVGEINVVTVLFGVGLSCLFKTCILYRFFT